MSLREECRMQRTGSRFLCKGSTTTLGWFSRQDDLHRKRVAQYINSTDINDGGNAFAQEERAEFDTSGKLETMRVCPSRWSRRWLIGWDGQQMVNHGDVDVGGLPLHWQSSWLPLVVTVDDDAADIHDTMIMWVMMVPKRQETLKFGRLMIGIMLIPDLSKKDNFPFFSHGGLLDNPGLVTKCCGNVIDKWDQVTFTFTLITFANFVCDQPTCTFHY